MSVTRQINLDEIRPRVFDRRESTAEEEAREYSLEELLSTLNAGRLKMRRSLEASPDSAFAAQSNDDAGDEVWSAGQVISHVCEAPVRFDFYNQARKLAGVSADVDAPTWDEYIGGPKVLSREESLAALALLESEYARLFTAIPDDVDLSRQIDYGPFGRQSLKGMVLQTALHENLHLHQINGFLE